MRFPGLGKIIGFFTLLGLACAAISHGIDTGMRQIQTSEFGSFNRALYGGLNPEIVISGSSRAVLHYDPRVFKRITGRSTFNLGRVGSHVDLQLALLKVFLRNNRAPRLLIHNIDFSSGTRSAQGEIYQPVQYAPYIDEPEIYQTLQRFIPGVWRWKYVPLYRWIAQDPQQMWRFGLKALLGRQPRENYTDGFCPRRDSWTRAFDKWKAEHSSIRLGVDSGGMRDLDEIAAICQERGIPAVFVFSPVYHEFAEMAVNRQQILGEFQKVAERHGVRFLDYSGSPLTRSTDNFLDHNHLNARGAELFSQDLSAHLTTVFAPSSPAPDMSDNK